MKVNVQAIRPARLAAMIVTAGLLPLAAAQAQGVSAADAQARYKEDLQRCSSIADPESRRTCQREAGAALHEARRNRLVTPADSQANAAARCARLPAERRADCERLMSDSSAVTHGSVSGGGVLRELTITVPADQATSSGYTTTQPATTGGYTTQPAPSGSGYNTQPAPTTGGYTTQPAPGGYTTQPAPTQNYSGQTGAAAPSGTR